MMDYGRIALGLAVGLLVGALNFYLMRVFVRQALKYSGRALGIAMIFASYAVRYVFIGAVVFWLMKHGEQQMAVVILAVLGAMTILLATLQRVRNPARDRCE